MTDPRFPVLTMNPLEVLICSDATPWTMHFDNIAKRSRRCGGLRCAMCAMGSPREEVNVVLAQDSQGGQHLIELRKRHAPTLQRMIEQRGSACGWFVKVCKCGHAKNSPVEVSLLSWERTNCHNISALVASLGLPALLLGSPSEVEEMHDSGTKEVRGSNQIASSQVE